MPYLISWVIVSYLVFAFFGAETGIVNNSFLKLFGIDPINWYSETKYWPFIIMFVYIWKACGYSMIIYFSTIVGISQDYYEAAMLDGATKWQQIKNITLPLLKPTIITMLILNVGRIFCSDFGLFYQVTRDSNSLINVTQTLDVYVHKALIQSNNYNYSSAVALLQSVLGCILLVIANIVVKKIDPESGLF